MGVGECLRFHPTHVGDITVSPSRPPGRACETARTCLGTARRRGGAGRGGGNPGPDVAETSVLRAPGELDIRGIFSLGGVTRRVYGARMRRALVTGGVALLVGVVGACSDAGGQTPSTSATNAAALEVELAVDATVNADGSVSVSAATNLPAGTKLGATVRSVDGTFTAQDSQTVLDGTASFGPFTAQGAALPAGTYDVNVTMPIARNQAQDVKDIIGGHGEHLAGPLVETESITGDAVVTVDTVLTVP